MPTLCNKGGIDMKENFEQPFVVLVSFETEDVITSSGQDLPDQEFSGK